MQTLATFLAELKRRRVFRVAIVYAGVTFIIFQIVDAIFVPLHIPEWIGTTIIVLLLIGFPIAVALAWAFDITEKGVVRAAKKPAEAKASRRVLIGNKTLGIVAALAIIAAAWSWWGRPASAGPITSIAVLPLVNLMGDPDQDYFVDGMHEALTAELSKISALRVIGRTSTMSYKANPKPIPEIAAELDVDAVIEGSVLRDGDLVRITAQLVATRPERHLWVNDYERGMEKILTLQKNVARAIAKEIKVALTIEEEAHLASARSINPEAYEAYLKGRYYWNKRTPAAIQKSLEYFHQALEEDPACALAYSGIADCYAVGGGSYLGLPPREARPKAKAAARKALELDETLAEAHTTLADCLLYYDWDWASAENEFNRAIQLNPNYATAHQWYSEYLVAMGRFEEAIAEATRAWELDPFSLILSVSLGWAYYFASQYDQAMEQFQKILEMDANFAQARNGLGYIYLQKRMLAEAVIEFQRAYDLYGEIWSLTGLGYAFAVMGRKAEAQQVIQELQAPADQSYVDPCMPAWVYVGLGDKENAFRLFDMAYEQRSGNLLYIKSHPLSDPLRSDPRFAGLLRRMNFPE